MTTKIDAQLEAARIKLSLLFRPRLPPVPPPETYLRDKLQGRDMFPCGFAWVRIAGVKGNTKLGKALRIAASQGVCRRHGNLEPVWPAGAEYGCEDGRCRSIRQGSD